MASISSLGVGSGLDLASIVSSLADAERAPTESRLNFKENNETTKLSAFGLLRSSLSSFQGSLSNLSSVSTYNSKEVNVTDSSVFSASVTSISDPGNYSVEVSDLATKHSLASNAATAFSDVTDTVGTGTLTIKFGETSTGPYSFIPDTNKATKTITVSSENGNTTLSGLRDYINDKDFGVQAGIVNDGSGYRLTLTSEDSGAKNSMEITVTDDGDGINDDNAGLSQLAYNANAQASVIQTVEAQDAALKINGLSITRDTNTVTGAINGVTLNLLKADAGNTVQVTVSENSNEVIAAVTDFVDSYNGFMATINSLTDYDAETGEAGILNGDFTVLSISRQMRSIVSGAVQQLDGNIRSLTDIGIKTKLDATLDFDESKLSSALKNYPSEVQALFALQGNVTDEGLTYSNATNNTEVGDYAVNITTMATQGVLNGSAVNSLVIGASNDVFTVNVNGTISSEITLSHDTYLSADSLASHIQAQINDDSVLKAAGASVTVLYDSLNNEFDITSSKFGSASKIEFVTLDSTMSTDLGFNLGFGTDGVDVAGTINGFGATGNGQTLTSDLGQSKGLELLVTSGDVGSRGSVSLSRGISETLDDLVGNFLSSNGFIESREDGLKLRLEQIADEREALNTRIANLEARLIQKFSALDVLIAQFNSTSNFLAQQLDGLVKPNSIGND